jgi:formamidopyrimidine-DNA glycosylase
LSLRSFACQSRNEHLFVPELPEVERAARILRRAAVDQTIERVTLIHPALRRRVSPHRLRTMRGARITGVIRRGKHQLLELDDRRVFQVHFRMAGDWDIGRSDDPLPRFARAIIELANGARISLVDPRALSTVELHPAGASPVEGLGLEPSDPALTPQALMTAFRRRHGPIKPVLLDQRIMAGVGNIYASEALWHAKISPRAVASALTIPRITRLLESIRHALGPAARLPGRYKEAPMSRRIAVYGKAGKPCRRCRTAIERIVQAGRSTYFCPRCQRV